MKRNCPDSEKAAHKVEENGCILYICKTLLFRIYTKIFYNSPTKTQTTKF